MADFPTSVFNPATRSPGQAIASAHVNSLQAEVTAIEDGFRNATAPLNSSGSTVATLSVLGGSTFAVRPVMPLDAVRLELDAVVEVPVDSTAPLSWTRQVFMTNSSLHSTATNSSRITPQSTGIYRFDLQLVLRTGSSRIELFIEDSSQGKIGYAEYHPAGAGEVAYACGGLKRFDVVGGYACAVAMPRTSTDSLSTANAYFSMVKL